MSTACRRRNQKQPDFISICADLGPWNHATNTQVTFQRNPLPEGDWRICQLLSWGPLSTESHFILRKERWTRLWKQPAPREVFCPVKKCELCSCDHITGKVVTTGNGFSLLQRLVTRQHYSSCFLKFFEKFFSTKKKIVFVLGTSWNFSKVLFSTKRVLGKKRKVGQSPWPKLCSAPALLLMIVKKQKLHAKNP